ncbi:MAG: hydroxyurea phosphotransferase [Dehalococcoidia bacterium]
MRSAPGQRLTAPEPGGSWAATVGRLYAVAMLAPELARKFVDLYGERGTAWVEAFPATLEGLRRRWGLTLGETFAYVGYAFVARVELPGGAPAVLKVAPTDPEFTNEIAALRLYQGGGAVRLLDCDPEATALLLERLEPGTPLAEMHDDARATEIAAGVMRELWRPLPPGNAFPTMEGWGQAFARVRAAYGGGSRPFPLDLFEKGERLYFELCATAARPVLLHGDLHHWNILAAGRGPWLAIDPKGVAGEPAYETGALLRNRMGVEPDLLRLTERRAAQLADALGLDRQRILGWAFAQGVLSALWTLEGHGSVGEEQLMLPRALAGVV